ncbi:MAG: hypothetical protein KAS32_07805 [Candidatus Peribacteraceae bacterium]|nr:hypothetical protein [Candidatus Peribacteraceae bacterium]
MGFEDLTIEKVHKTLYDWGLTTTPDGIIAIKAENQKRLPKEIKDIFKLLSDDSSSIVDTICVGCGIEKTIDLPYGRSVFGMTCEKCGETKIRYKRTVERNKLMAKE